MSEVPFIFQDNSPALASEVNANFNDLDNKILELARPLMNTTQTPVDCSLDPNALVNAVDDGFRNILVTQGDCNGGLYVRNSLQITGAGKMTTGIVGNGLGTRPITVHNGSLWLNNISVRGEPGIDATLLGYGQSYVELNNVDLYCNGGTRLGYMLSSVIRMIATTSSDSCSGNKFKIISNSSAFLSRDNSFVSTDNDDVFWISDSSTLDLGNNNVIHNSVGPAIVFGRGSAGNLTGSEIIGDVYVTEMSAVSIGKLNWQADLSGERNLYIQHSDVKFYIYSTEGGINSGLNLFVSLHGYLDIKGPALINSNIELDDDSLLVIHEGSLDTSSSIVIIDADSKVKNYW